MTAEVALAAVTVETMGEETEKGFSSSDSETGSSSKSKPKSKPMCEQPKSQFRLVVVAT
jgi:hypothetical protein